MPMGDWMSADSAALGPLPDQIDQGQVALIDQPEEAAIRTILIVDDSRAQLRLTGQVLRRLGYSVVEALSGVDALSALEGGGIDLVLSDWVMPGMSGLDLCRAFRELGGDHYVYFILLTSKSDRGDVATGLAAGADDFLSKPIDTEELKARISAGGRLVAVQRTLEEKNRLLGGALTELQTLYDNLGRDLAEARRLQQSLVPERQRHYPGADVSLLLRPCGQVGGDLVGAFRVNDTRIGIFSIDVSGHGIASALMTARLASYLTGSSPEQNVALSVSDAGEYSMRSLPEVCSRLNHLLIDDMATELYFTMAIADCDLRTGRLSIVQAGHPHPLVQRADGTVQFVGDGGMPIGLLNRAEYTAFDLQLSPGDRLFLHSDGFTEAESRDGKMLDQDGLARLVESIPEAKGQDFTETMMWLLADHARNADFDDDVSGVVLEYKGIGSEKV